MCLLAKRFLQQRHGLAKRRTASLLGCKLARLRTQHRQGYRECSVCTRYVRKDEPPQDIFDKETQLRGNSMQLRSDQACALATGSSSLYVSIFILDSDAHRMKFELKTETCGSSCEYTVRTLSSGRFCRPADVE